jgi:biopolymer transport protein ExbD
MAAGSSVYKDGDAEVISDINVTPLVDVVLVLLVIFMVTAPIVAARGILVNAPTTVSGDSVATPVQVTLTADGKLYVKGTEQSDFDAARAELTQLYQADRGLKAVIAADAAVSHGQVMQAIDAVKRAGIQKFALASRKPEDDPAR